MTTRRTSSGACHLVASLRPLADDSCCTSWPAVSSPSAGTNATKLSGALPAPGTPVAVVDGVAVALGVGCAVGVGVGVGVGSVVCVALGGLADGVFAGGFG